MSGEIKLVIWVILIVVISIVSLTIFNIYKRESKQGYDVVEGGIVDNSYDAPKTIESKELSSVETEVFYSGKKENGELADEYGYVEFKLKRDGDNNLILSESGRLNTSVNVGDEVLDGVQKIIDEYRLAELNGTVRYTSGLPALYSPVYFKAEYANGEKIYFLVDGDPEAEWSGMLAEYLMGVLEG